MLVRWPYEVDPILWTKMGVAKVEPAELNTSWS